MSKAQRGDRISLGGGQYDRLPALAADLARRQVAVIVARSTAAHRGQGGNHDIPIVFTLAATGPVRARRKPQPAGWQPHGCDHFGVETGPKRLELRTS